MKVAVYEDRNAFKNARAAEALLAAKHYFDRNGFDCDFIKTNSFRLVDADIAVIWGYFDPASPPGTKKTHQRRAVSAHQKRRGKMLLVVEGGFIDRAVNYSLGMNDITNNGEYLFRIVKTPNVLLQPLRPAGDALPILFAGQVPWDTAIRLGGKQNYIEWAENTARALRERSNRPVHFKPHPNLLLRGKKSPLKTKAWCKLHHMKLVTDRTVDLRKYHAVVAYNSTILLEAIIAGVPCFAHDKGSVVYDLCNKNLDDIESPWFPDDEARSHRILELVNCQFTVEELRSGEPFQPYVERATAVTA
eukprot:jgi/Tetstr1/464144/TSEL_008949.t1